MHRDCAGRSPAPEPPILTVGELRSELSRWPDDAAVNFRCPLQEQEFRLYRFQSPSPAVVEIELNQYPETPGVARSEQGMRRG